MSERAVACRAAALAAITILAAPHPYAQTRADPAAGLEQIITTAESSLHTGELQIAESQYRSALMAGWMLIGTLRADEQRFDEARNAFQRASTSVVDGKPALQALALVHLRTREPARAVVWLLSEELSFRTGSHLVSA